MPCGLGVWNAKNCGSKKKGSLGADDEEQNKLEEDARVAPKIKFSVNASFTVNFCLFVIQLYAAISTGSLSVCDASPTQAKLTCPLSGKDQPMDTMLTYDVLAGDLFSFLQRLPMHL